MAFEEIIYVVDTDDAERFFDYAGYMARRIETPLSRVRRRLLERIALSFELEESPEGVPWRDLAEGYKTRKLAIYGHVYPILIGTEHLANRATSQRSARIYHDGVGEGELIYELDVPYAAAHQFGGWWDEGSFNEKTGETRAPSQHPPARPFFSLAGFDDISEDIFREWLEDIRSRNTKRNSVDMESPL